MQPYRRFLDLRISLIAFLDLSISLITFLDLCFIVTLVTLLDLSISLIALLDLCFIVTLVTLLDLRLIVSLVTFSETTDSIVSDSKSWLNNLLIVSKQRVKGYLNIYGGLPGAGIAATIEQAASAT